MTICRRLWSPSWSTAPPPTAGDRRRRRRAHPRLCRRDHVRSRSPKSSAAAGAALGVLFIDCDDVRLERRYTETRRPHPLAGDRSIMDGIRRERQVVSPLRDRADLVIDTSDLTAADLKRVLTGHFALDRRGMGIFVTSFAYRAGIPREADLIFDVRFLDNPHYVEALRGLTGCDPAVAAHIEGDPDFAPFFARLWRLLRPLLPRYEIRGQDLSYHRHRLHRRAPPFGLCRRAADRAAARSGMANRDRPSRSFVGRPGRADPGGRIRRRRLSRRGRFQQRKFDDRHGLGDPRAARGGIRRRARARRRRADPDRRRLHRSR